MSAFESAHSVGGVKLAYRADSPEFARLLLELPPGLPRADIGLLALSPAGYAGHPDPIYSAYYRADKGLGGREAFAELLSRFGVLLEPDEGVSSAYALKATGGRVLLKLYTTRAPPLPCPHRLVIGCGRWHGPGADARCEVLLTAELDALAAWAEGRGLFVPPCPPGQAVYLHAAQLDCAGHLVGFKTYTRAGLPAFWAEKERGVGYFGRELRPEG